jgi:hypothetical protein
MVLECGLDTLDLCPPERLARLAEVRRICEARGIEIIPIVFSAGYGSAVLAHNPNLAEGLPVKDALFQAQGGEARLVQDPAVALANGGFEDFKDGKFAGLFHDRPGTISFVDQEVFHSGKASIRFQDFSPDDKERVHARVSFEAKVRPYTQYCLTAWFRTQDLDPTSKMLFQVYAGSRQLTHSTPCRKPTQDWTRGRVTVNSGANTSLRFWLGAWGASSGRFWLDDVRLEQEGLQCVLRRPGTPLRVTSEDGATILEEGKDFAPVADPKLRDFSGNHEDVPIKLLPGSRVKDGDRLRVSYYRGAAISEGQVSVCMSEPEVYDIWRTQARLMGRYLAPKRYLLSMDEIRAGGTCEACKARHMTMGEILGDCITKQVKLIRDVSPKAEVLIWSDMLDPNHNAHGDYYLVDGDFTGSWLHVPKDLVIACWYYPKRAASLKFFSDLGVRTLAAAYYDGDDLENCKGWLEAIDATPGAQGIMYTTWQSKYALLAGFGDLVSKR